MRHRVLSLAMAGLVILATAVSAFAQVAVITPTALGRVDQIVNFASTNGVPPLQSGTFQPQIRATDTISAGQGAQMVSYVQDLDAYFANRFGWRSSKPVSVQFYSSSSNLINDAQSLMGGTLSTDQSNIATSEPAFLFMATQGNGVVPANSWVIAVNTDPSIAAQQFMNVAGSITSINAGLVPSGTQVNTSLTPEVVNNTTNNATAMIQESIAKQYTNLMMSDLGGNNVPQWFRDGLSNSIAFSIVPGFPTESGWAETVARSQSNNMSVPAVSQLGQSFPTLLGAGGSSAAIAEGISFLGARSLLDTLGGTNMTSFLKGLGSGTSFDSELSNFGTSFSQLNSQTQSLIPIP